MQLKRRGLHCKKKMGVWLAKPGKRPLQEPLICKGVLVEGSPPSVSKQSDSRPPWTHWELWTAPVSSTNYYGPHSRVVRAFPEIHHIDNDSVVLQLYQYVDEAALFITIQTKTNDHLPKAERYLDSRMVVRRFRELNKVFGVDFTVVETFIVDFLDRANHART